MDPAPPRTSQRYRLGKTNNSTRESNSKSQPSADLTGLKPTQRSSSIMASELSVSLEVMSVGQIQRTDSRQRKREEAKVEKKQRSNSHEEGWCSGRQGGGRRDC